METKQVIVVRKDLNMRKGKMCAQAAHASLGAIFSDSYTEEDMSSLFAHSVKCIPMQEHLADWFNDKFTKIVVGCNSEEELLSLGKQADAAGLLNFVCRDAGLTEFGGVATYTALAIGPATTEEIDKPTGHLKLL